MSKILINLVTHSSYADVCQNFLSLLKKNWSDCPYDFIISIIGQKISFDGYICHYHGKNCKLPEAIYKEISESDYEYCISFLGDAFINSKINNEEVFKLIHVIENCNIEYCCLIPRKPFRFKKKKVGDMLRYISSYDAYNMCFVAFIASRKFILKEFCNGISDLEFEKKYLEENTDNYFFYTDRVIVTKNVFNLVPGIDAGKWNRHAIKILKNSNSDISFCDRERISFFKNIFSDIIHFSQIIVSKKQRRIIKKFLKNIFGIKFTTDF